jgi:hypothetical protein
MLPLLLEHSQREVHRIFRNVTSTPDRGPLLGLSVPDSWHPQREPPEISKWYLDGFAPNACTP